MIKYVTQAICDNCDFVLDVSEKSGGDFYAAHWDSGITYDICETCGKGELKQELRRRMVAEEVVRKSFEIQSEFLEAN